MTIEEVARRAGTSVRTTRFYIAEGLLPGPVGTGRAADYTEEHLVRLQAILQMRRQNMPLSQIRRAVVGVPAEQLRSEAGSALAYIDQLLGGPPAPSGPLPAPPPAGPSFDRLPSAPDALGPPVGERWRRIPIHPDIELSVREPIPPGLASRLDRVVERLKRTLEGKED